jgi:hypothetical protein
MQYSGSLRSHAAAILYNIVIALKDVLQVFQRFLQTLLISRFLIIIISNDKTVIFNNKLLDKEVMR